MDITKKMERWIETRLWNKKVKNESIAIRQIIFEFPEYRTSKFNFPKCLENE